MDTSSAASVRLGWAVPPEPLPIDRDALRSRLREDRPWDVVIVGGGATGLGVAVEAALRGLRVALIEAGDFASGTSSRSTKLVHGGVRYLAQGNVKLVREALLERATLLRIAPHVVRPLEFVVPCYGLFERPFLRVGLGLYDLLAGRHGIGRTKWLSRDETLHRLPGLRPEGLRGGVLYWDGQFDDARMAIALMQTAFALGAVPINGVRCVGLQSAGGRIVAVQAEDAETAERFSLRATCVVNACGVWIDHVRHFADPGLPGVVRVSQGSHLVVDRAFMPGSNALMIPKTRDGRVLFAVPWQDRVIIGTTDVARDDAPVEPRPSSEEIDFIRETARGYMRREIRPEDVLSSFAGLRPLYSPRDAALGHSGSTAAISREHAVLVECGNLVTVVGGKWTTYRRMAVDALTAAARAGLVELPAADSSMLPLVRDRVLEDAASDPARLASHAEARAAFVEYCRNFTLARDARDALLRRSRAEGLNFAAGPVRS